MGTLTIIGALMTALGPILSEAGKKNSNGNGTGNRH